jgi:hypothetical protein
MRSRRQKKGNEIREVSVMARFMLYLIRDI